MIRSYEALVLAEVLVLALFLHRAARGFALARFAAPVLLGFVVVLQHRSVWVATLTGAMAAILIGRSASSRSAEQILLVVAIVTMTALPLALDERLASVGQQVGSSAGNALEGRGTTGSDSKAGGKSSANGHAEARIRLPSDRTSEATPAVCPRGERQRCSQDRLSRAQLLRPDPVANTGLFGLLTFSAHHGLCGPRPVPPVCQSSRGGPRDERVCLVLILMQLAYYIPYGADYLQSLVFGVAIAYASPRTTVR